MVIGFVGGFVKHDARAHSTVQVVEHLRNEYREGVYVRSFANRHRDQAYKEIVRRLDGDNDGTLSAEEKQQGKGGFEQQLRREWEAEDAYAADAYRLLVNANVCLKCHQVGTWGRDPIGPRLLP